MTQPNVLWICTDQQRFDTLGCYGNNYVTTPNIDRLAEHGVRFDRCYSQSPVCSPSRASFLTGRYPRTTGCRQNGQAINEDETLVTKLLSEAGYTCGLAGKLHIAPNNPNKSDAPYVAERRIDDGYADFHYSVDPNIQLPANEYHHWLLDRDVEYTRSPVYSSEHVATSVPAEHHQTTWCTEKTIHFIEWNADFDEPWLFSVNIFDPHHPFDPPEEYLERYLDRLEAIPGPNYEQGELEGKPVFQQEDHTGAYGGKAGFPFSEMDVEDHRLIRAAYWAMVDLVDEQVGRMLDALERTGQREDTLVIFTSDHGEMLGDHGIYLKGPYFYEPAVRVPLIVTGPGVQQNVETEGLVELSDLAPTLMEMAGEDPPEGMQTRSLWPVLAGDRDPEQHRDDVYCEYYNAMPWHHRSETADALPFGTMVRTDRYKLVQMHRTGTGELYDLEEDPTETWNRWDDPEYMSVKIDLLERLADRMAGTVDPLPERQAPY